MSILAPHATDRSNALEVETAGYAILALMAHDPAANTLQARKIVKWITSKRNGQGGFYSTQVGSSSFLVLYVMKYNMLKSYI